MRCQGVSCTARSISTGSGAMNRQQTTNQSPEVAWAMHVFLTLVVALALVGFVVGLRQGKTPYVPAPPERKRFVPDPAAIPSTTWAQFDRRKDGPNREWSNNLVTLKQPTIDVFANVIWQEDQRKNLLIARATRRAFDGAPPVVPHPIDQMSTSSCIVCHAKGLFIGSVHAPQISHQVLTNCTQCHVEQSSSRTESFLFAASEFEGLEAPTLGTRAWTGAPPTIPHATNMRDNCQACHGPTGPQAIRSTHPWRSNCLQCHAPSAALDQAGSRASAAFLPPPMVIQP
jgi:cytochrome c-type protein NapB